MKVLIFALFLLQSSPGYAQRIKNVEIDKFTGKKRIQTENVTIGGSFLKVMYTHLRTLDTTILMTFEGNYGAGVVGTSDPTTFLFGDKSSFAIYPTGIQTYEDHGADQTFHQQYLISKDQLETLARNNPVALRRTYSSNYLDVDIKNKRAVKISELAAMVLKEMNKN